MSEQRSDRFLVTLRLGRTDIEDPELEDDVIEGWLQERLEHVTSLLGGEGRVGVDRIDPLRVDVTVRFTVEGTSVADVMERYCSDFGKISPICTGVDVHATKTFKLCLATVGGEQFAVFVRKDPESGEPIYTDD